MIYLAWNDVRLSFHIYLIWHGRDISHIILLLHVLQVDV